MPATHQHQASTSYMQTTSNRQSFRGVQRSPRPGTAAYMQGKKQAALSIQRYHILCAALQGKCVVRNIEPIGPIAYSGQCRKVEILITTEVQRQIRSLMKTLSWCRWVTPSRSLRTLFIARLILVHIQSSSSVPSKMSSSRNQTVTILPIFQTS